MNGFNVTPGGHPINILPPVSISGGKTAQAFSMKQAEHASIGILFGATSSPPVAPVSIQVNLCTDANGSNPTPLPNFRYYYQTTAGAGHDIMDGNAQALANTPSKPPNFTSGTAGITHASGAIPTDVTGLQFWIEIDSAETCLPADTVGGTTEYPYIQVVIADAGNATYACIVVILSGLRYAFNVGATQTT